MAYPFMPTRRIILAGGSGFLGRTLIAWLGARGCESVVLTRSPGSCFTSPATRAVAWDARTPGLWMKELDGAEALINLAGRSVNCRYTPRNRAAIVESRTLSTRILGEAVGACGNPPRVWLNLSTATIYRHTSGEAHDERGEIAATPEAKDAFSIEVARAWEEAFDRAHAPRTRKVILRTSMVFGREPWGVYEVLRRLVRFGLGGNMAHGGQFVSWIHATDFCRAVAWLIDRDSASGTYNIASPHPVTNFEMMRTLRRVLHRPIGLPAARWMLEVAAFLMRTETELIIKSRRVVPARMLEEGFTFRFPSLDAAVADLEGGHPESHHEEVETKSAKPQA